MLGLEDHARPVTVFTMVECGSLRREMDVLLFGRFGRRLGIKNGTDRLLWFEIVLTALLTGLVKDIATRELGRVAHSASSWLLARSGAGTLD